MTMPRRNSADSLRGDSAPLFLGDDLSGDERGDADMDGGSGRLGEGVAILNRQTARGVFQSEDVCARVRVCVSRVPCAICAEPIGFAATTGARAYATQCGSLAPPMYSALI
eukprot:Opistho-1_new@38690